MEELLKAAEEGKLRTGALNFADRVFENEINTAIRHTQQVILLPHGGVSTPLSFNTLQTCI